MNYWETEGKEIEDRGDTFDAIRLKQFEADKAAHDKEIKSLYWTLDALKQTIKNQEKDKKYYLELTTDIINKERAVAKKELAEKREQLKKWIKQYDDRLIIQKKIDEVLK